MLVSHRKQFIFLKTAKTAGTSVESYFEQYCMPEGEWEECEAREAYVSDTGIIGLRASDTTGATWYNHMPAAKVCDQVGQDVWDRYFKFTIVRNPFDKLISRFFHEEKVRESDTRGQGFGAGGNCLPGTSRPEGRARGKTPVSRFRSWIRNGGSIIDRDIYLIDGEVCVDFFIRYEDMQAGIQHVCEQVDVPFEPARLPGFKRGMRSGATPVRKYYDKATEKVVRKLYVWEFEHFGYDMPVP